MVRSAIDLTASRRPGGRRARGFLARTASPNPSSTAPSLSRSATNFMFGRQEDVERRPLADLLGELARCAERHDDVRVDAPCTLRRDPATPVAGRSPRRSAEARASTTTPRASATHSTRPSPIRPMMLKTRPRLPQLHHKDGLHDRSGTAIVDPRIKLESYDPRHDRVNRALAGEASRKAESRDFSGRSAPTSVHRLRLRSTAESGKTKTDRRHPSSGFQSARDEPTAARTPAILDERPRQDEDGTVSRTSWHQGESVQRGGRPDRHGLQATVPGDDPPSRLEQVLRQPGRSIDGPGLRRKGERQDGPSAPSDVGDRGIQPGQPRRSGCSSSPTTTSTRTWTTSGSPSIPTIPSHVLSRWQLQDHMDAILSLGVTQLVDLLTAEKVDLSVLSLDQRRDLLLLAALYDASTGEPIEQAMEPAPPTVGVPSALDPPRPPDRLRHDPGGRRLDRAVPQPPKLVAAPLADRPAGRRVALLGMAAGPRRVVRPRHPQGPEGARAATPRPCAGSCSGSSPASSAASRCRPPRGAGPRSATSCSASSRGCCTRSATAAIIVLIDRVDEPQQIEGDPAQDARVHLASARSQVPATPGDRRQAPAADRAGLLP